MEVKIHNFDKYIIILINEFLFIYNNCVHDYDFLLDYENKI